MILPGLSTAWRTIVVVVVVVAMAVGGFYAYSAYDRYKQRQRQKLLDAAGVHVQAADTLVAQADTQQVLILPTKRGFNAAINSPQVRNNPVARPVADTARKIIKADSITIDKQKKAIAHLDSAVVDLQKAGPPLGPRAVPYGVVGYMASNRQRAVPMVKLGIDYRLLPHVMANAEVSYQPPVPKDTKQTPEFRVFVGGKVTFR